MALWVEGFGVEACEAWQMNAGMGDCGKVGVTTHIKV